MLYYEKNKDQNNYHDFLICSFYLHVVKIRKPHIFVKSCKICTMMSSPNNDKIYLDPRNAKNKSLKFSL